MDDRQGECDRVGGLGRQCLSLGQYERAIEHCTQELAISREIGDRESEVLALCTLGDANAYLGQHERGIEHLTQALTISREIGDRRDEVMALGTLGKVLARLGQHERGIEHLTQALTTSREIGDRQDELNALGTLGEVYVRLGQHERSIEHYTQALAISREIGDQQAEGLALATLGNVHITLGQHEGTIEHCTQALAISREIGDRRVEGLALCDLGGAYISIGQHERAIEHYAQALAIISSEIGDRRVECGVLANLGGAYIGLARHERAIEHCTQALAISREIGDRRVEGLALCNLGGAYFGLAQHERAIEHCTQALAISREIGDRKSEVFALCTLCRAYINLGQDERAMEHCTQALTISLEIDDRRGEGNAISTLGAMHCRLGQYERAIEHHTQALIIFREIGDRRSEGGALGSLGFVYDNLGQYERAIEHFMQGLAISREIGDQLQVCSHLLNLGHASDSLGLHERAIEHHTQALDVYDQLWRHLSSDEQRVSFGDSILPVRVASELQLVLLKLGRHLEALEVVERSRASSLELLLAQQHVQHGAHTDSPAHTATPVPSWEQMREYAVAHGACLLVYSQVKPNRVLVWAVMPDATREPLFCDHELSETSLATLVEETRQALGLERRLARAPLRTPATTSMREVHVDFDVHDLPIAADGDTYGCLSSDENSDGSLDDSALSTAPCTRSSMCNHRRRRGSTCAGARGATQRTKRSREEQEAEAETTARRLLHRCYALLIEPMADALHGCTKLIVLPDHQLHALPFAALLDSENGEGRHLIERHALSIAPSVGSLLQLDARPVLPLPAELGGAVPALIVGVSDYSACVVPSKLLHEEDLANAQEDACREHPRWCRWLEVQAHEGSRRVGLDEVSPAERRAIAKLLAVGDVVGEQLCHLDGAKAEAVSTAMILVSTRVISPEYLLDSQATRMEVMRQAVGARVLHIASHGSPTGLHLGDTAAATAADRELTLAHVETLDLGAAELAVLSGCDTFQGDTSTDGLIGIARTFLSRGCRALVASLWGVNDAETPKLMDAFYRHLTRSSSPQLAIGDPAEALRAAMCERLERHRGKMRRVRLWAPFVVFGAPAIQPLH